MSCLLYNKIITIFITEGIECYEVHILYVACLVVTCKFNCYKGLEYIYLNICENDLLVINKLEKVILLLVNFEPIIDNYYQTLNQEISNIISELKLDNNKEPLLSTTKDIINDLYLYNFFENFDPKIYAHFIVTLSLNYLNYDLIYILNNSFYNKNKETIIALLSNYINLK